MRVAMLWIFAQLKDIAKAVLATCIVAAALILVGIRQIASLFVRTVSLRTSSVLVDFTYCYQVANDSFSNVYPCPDVEGSYSAKWCCGHTGTSKSCCNESTFNFDRLPGGRGYFFWPADDRAAASTSVTATKTLLSTFVLTTSAASPTQPPVYASTPKHSESSTHDRTTGLGVGVPIAVLGLGALMALLVREHRRRGNAETIASDLIKSRDQVNGQPWQNGNTTGYGNEINNRRWTQELPAPTGPMELQSRQIHEVSNGA